MSRFRLFYALAGIIWLAWYTYAFATASLAERNPHFVRSYLFCLVVLVAVPVSLGYILLFKATPWIVRRFNPAR